MMSPTKCDVNLTDTSIQQMKESYLNQQSPVSYHAEEEQEVEAFEVAVEVQEIEEEPIFEQMEDVAKAFGNAHEPPNNLFQFLIQKNQEHRESISSERNSSQEMMNRRTSNLTDGSSKLRSSNANSSNSLKFQNGRLASFGPQQQNTADSRGRQNVSCSNNQILSSARLPRMQEERQLTFQYETLYDKMKKEQLHGNKS